MNPRLLLLAFVRPQLRELGGRLLSPVVLDEYLLVECTKGMLTSDILLGIVIITEYPLSVVFSICLLGRSGGFDLDCTRHSETDTFTALQ